MPKLRFLGTEERPESIAIRGVSFPKGESVEVTDAYTFEKCLALPYFEEVKRGRRKKADGDV